MNDYARIAQVIRYLDACHDTQPDLQELADLVGLSPFHFHRLFKQWAGITPKGFVQCLTLEASKRALREGRAILDASLEVGLSGPSRLHDLCVKLEAATPGEIKSGGEGLRIQWGVGETPFGHAFLAQTERGLCHLAFLETEARDAQPELGSLKVSWPQAQLQRDDEAAQKQLGNVFQPAPSEPLTAWVRGTDFQISVWRALLAIPSGRLSSYGLVAKAIGKPAASRAVGTAVGRNPLAYLIPCHRVIRETGVIGHYRWGHGRKRTLIAWESALRNHAETH